MDNQIREWLNSIAIIKRECDLECLPNYSKDLKTISNQECNTDIAEVSVEDILNIQLNNEDISIEDIAKGKLLDGEGTFTIQNGDYFRGDFRGNIMNRQGIFVQLSKGGRQIEGTWRNGHAEVIHAYNSGQNAFVQFLKIQ